MSDPAPTQLPALAVEVVAPAAPYILASPGFMSTLATVERTVDALKIADLQSAQAAVDLQARLTLAGNSLEKQRKALKQPFIEAGKKIDDAAKAPSERIENAKRKLKNMITAFEESELQRVAEEQRKQAEELARLETQRQKEEKEKADQARKDAEEALKAQMQAQEQAKAVADAAVAAGVQVEALDFEEPVPEGPVLPLGEVIKTETELKIEAIRYTPPAEVAKPTGIRYKVTLVPIVEDVNKVPDMFVTRTANLTAIRATFCQGWSDGSPIPELAGVRFEVKKDAQTTGRNLF